MQLYLQVAATVNDLKWHREENGISSENGGFKHSSNAKSRFEKKKNEILVLYCSIAHLVSSRGETGVPLGQDALHPNDEGSLDLHLLSPESGVKFQKQDILCFLKSFRSATNSHHLPKRGRDGRVHGHDRAQLVVVQRVDVVVDGVAGQLDLRQPQVHRSRLGDVHDLAVGGQDEDEAVQRLEEVGAELLQDLRTLGQDGFHAPAVTQT